MRNYNNLMVYNKAYELALTIQRLSKKLIEIRQYSLNDQITRASRSIPSNIAEGYGRGKSAKDAVNFLKTALGSTDEVIFNIRFMIDTNMLDQKELVRLIAEYKTLAKQLFKLIEHIKKIPATNNW